MMLLTQSLVAAKQTSTHTKGGPFKSAREAANKLMTVPTAGLLPAVGKAERAYGPPWWPPGVPQRIFLSWKTHNVPRHVLERWRALNPSFEVTLFNDSECADFVRGEIGEPYLTGYLAALYFSGMAATDLWRFLILYKYGGVYADIDVEPIAGLHHFVRPTDTLVTVGSMYSGVVNPLFLVAREGESMLRHAAYNQLVAINRTLRSKAGANFSRERKVPSEYSANSCYTLGREMPKQVLSNTKNNSFRVWTEASDRTRWGDRKLHARRRPRQIRLLHEASVIGGSWRNATLMKHITGRGFSPSTLPMPLHAFFSNGRSESKMNTHTNQSTSDIVTSTGTSITDSPDPTLEHRRQMFRLLDRHGWQNKERVALDGDRVVLFNRWPTWRGQFGRGAFAIEVS